jgi:hypothetical protein
MIRRYYGIPERTDNADPIPLLLLFVNGRSSLGGVGVRNGGKCPACICRLHTSSNNILSTDLSK